MHVVEDPTVLNWRLLVLVCFGVTPEVADRAAMNASVDVRRVEALISAGCPPDLAVDLVTPAEDDLVPD